ncbi:Acetylornithine aminotransferase [Porphyridium purpureum]|uniref:acetylornithine transaminase n=1 Tax=Porphyridium purpureum TaxID=35688 RepID=A0A5J4Z180_PORPP|nr:Acetylornithine aminotransferase [Porphyridium purpureum]|eukprot:POR0789..scf208_2
MAFVGHVNGLVGGHGSHGNVPAGSSCQRQSVVRCTPRTSRTVYMTVSKDAVAVPTNTHAPAAVQPGESHLAHADAYKFEDFDQYVMNTYVRFKIAITKGAGCKLYDSTGKEYLDLVAGIATCTLGHGDARLAKTVQEVMSNVHHVSNLFYIPPQGELAKKLAQRSIADRVFFCNSGAEANEAAIKLTRKYFFAKPENDGKVPVIITANQSFHGRTLATVTATGQAKYQKNFTPLVQGFEYCNYNDVEGLKAVVEKLKNSSTHKLAGIMMEALQGEGGVVPATYPFLRTARNLCDDNDALLIFDEVQVGVGRTGSLWGYEQSGVLPDVFTVAKGLAGGVPIGAMLCREKCNVFKPGEHASTFGGNFLATSCGLTVFNALFEGNVLENVKQRGAQLKAGLLELQAKYPSVVEECRGMGLIQGVQLKSSAGFTSIDIVGKAIEKGVLFVPAGPSVLRMVPPLVISAAEIAQGLSTLDAVFAELSK